MPISHLLVPPEYTSKTFLGLHIAGMNKTVQVTCILIKSKKFLILKIICRWISRWQNKAKTIFEVFFRRKFEAKVCRVFNQVLMIFRVLYEISTNFWKENVIFKCMKPILPTLCTCIFLVQRLLLLFSDWELINVRYLLITIIVYFESMSPCNDIIFSNSI